MKGVVKRFDHQFPKQLIGHDLDLAPLLGNLERYLLELVEVLPGFANGCNPVEPGMRQLEQHLDKTVAAISIVTSKVAVTVHVESLHLVDHVAVLVLMQQEKDLDNDDRNVGSALVLGESGNLVEELPHPKPLEGRRFSCFGAS